MNLKRLEGHHDAAQHTRQALDHVIAVAYEGQFHFVFLFIFFDFSYEISMSLAFLLQCKTAFSFDESVMTQVFVPPSKLIIGFGKSNLFENKCNVLR